MVSKVDLKKAVDKLIRRTTIPSKINYRRNIGDSIYEAYVFSLLLKAIGKIGGIIKLRSINYPNSAPPTFLFRGAPGNIYGSSYDFGYAVFEYKKNIFEIHLGVFHEGTSGVRHELDISIIDGGHTNHCRSKNILPKANYTKAIIECKFYSGTLGTSLIRTFVGLKDDMGSLYISRFVANKNEDNISKYCSGKENRPRFNGMLIPRQEEEQQFVHELMGDLKKWLS